MYKRTIVSVIRESLSTSVRHKGDFVARFCWPSRNVFEDSDIFSMIILTSIMDHKLSVNILKFDVRIAFPSGLARSYLDFLLSFDYPLSINSLESNCKGKQNEWYFRYPLSSENINHENKLH